MGRKPGWPPKIYRHPSGQARIYLDGRHIYLGTHGSDEAAKRYAAIVRRGPGKVARPIGTSVAQICVKYLRHATSYYRDEDGKPTSQVEYVRRAIGMVIDRHGQIEAAEFRPTHLKEIRDALVSRGWARSNINQHIKVIRQMFRWAVSEELVPVEVYQALMTVPHLRAGRSEAKETRAITPVPLADIEATKRHLASHLCRAVEIQLWTACRPGELLAMRRDEIDDSGQVWRWTPRRHKTRWRGKVRVILIGPRAQQAIAQLPDHGYLIQPGAANKTKGRRVSARYTVRAYNHAIARACRRAGIIPWSPHRLRHTAATILAEEFGVEVARVILGHSSLSATLVYAEASIKRAQDAIILKG